MLKKVVWQRYFVTDCRSRDGQISGSRERGVVGSQMLTPSSQLSLIYDFFKKVADIRLRYPDIKESLLL